MTHKDEIKYWAEHDDDTKVWYKNHPDKDWYITAFPTWCKDIKYIVNDEWAELRKAQADGKQLQVYVDSPNGEWTNLKFKKKYMKDSKPSEWRIKSKEPVYEWQWIYKDSNTGMFKLTMGYYTTSKGLQEVYGYGTTFTKYLLSKRRRQ